MNKQMNNAVRKIHNLHTSGAVTVTGLSQPRILKQKIGSGIVTSSNTHSNLQQQQTHHVNTSNRCYVCDDALGSSQQQNLLTETQTSHTSTKFPNKIGQLVGDAFMVIVSVDDVVCARCTNLLNYLDRLENDVERVRTNLMNLLHKKYGLNDDSGGCNSAATLSPPIKMQKLNSGTAARTVEESSGVVGGGSELGRVRKVVHAVSSDASIGKQSPPVVSAVQQMKISTQGVTQNTPVGSTQTQTIQRKTTRIYKCISCDYKTSDMRLFNTHYETCKSQNFQCKNCKKIFPNFGSMKQHMVREHNTTMDNTCAVCHINFVNEPALRKHMEANHSTNVVVTSTTTLPLTQQQTSDTNTTASGGNTTTTTPLYTCNHCQFKSTDKALFDEHFRKHLSGVKPKPFKCRLCAQRFETREAATIHAKQHQPNYFKCGTCSMSFPKRELLVKHFEVHQQPQQQQQQQQQQQTTVVQHQQIVTQSAPMVKQLATPKQQQQQHHQQQHATSQNMLTTQKLLQETIDEALSDNTTTVVSSGNTDVVTTAANNIRFFSCHICSLTFIQEHYYNQHMEAHSQDKEGVGSGGGTSGTTITTTTSSASGGGGGHNMLHPSAAALLNDDNKDIDGDSGDLSSHHGGGSGVEADIESIFEKMHSEKNDHNDSDTNAVTSNTSNSATPTNITSSAAGQCSNDSLVITSQQGSGGITFNITIPQPESTGQKASEISKSIPTTTAPVSVSIDMPVLDQPDESATSSTTGNKSGVRSSKEAPESRRSNSADRKVSGPVSMPSLDDDNDSQEQKHSIQAQSMKKDKTSIEMTKGDDSREKRNSIENAENCTETKESIKEEASAPEETDATAVDADTADANGESHSENAAADATAGEAESEHNHQVAMELDEAMQAQVESGQIKFILNENGQLLQLDNHIITDADGNQILVQDPEQIQQLLQSAGLLQSGDGLDGETLQMMTDANGQMVLVQGENNETQLIDASLLNADGQLVIQQGHDGDLGEGAHVIGEDGTRIPVSVSYTADGQPIVRVQQQMLEGEAGEEEEHQEASTVAATTEQGASQVAAESSATTGAANTEASAVSRGEADASASGDGGDESTAGPGDGTLASSSGGGSGADFFPLEDLMQQSTENKPAE
ncbi:autotransporter adhesin BpaC [Eurosta solidaginis]|uniref:autotransporter adhesin BpaC n=1 Tax=Eurosta solidaginis TaxID=178769 RepID=UPI003530FF2A